MSNYYLLEVETIDDKVDSIVDNNDVSSVVLSPSLHLCVVVSWVVEVGSVLDAVGSSVVLLWSL